MAPQIQILTDSSAQLPNDLAAELEISVVPAVIELDGLTFLEGVDMDASAFYDALTSDSNLCTSQPSPGSFVEAVEAAASAGAEQVLAILVGSSYSGTVQSARLAASMTSIPLKIVDSGTASFGTACCVLRAHELLSAGASIGEAATAALEMGAQVQSVFVLQGLELAERSGRFPMLSGIATSRGAGQVPSEEEDILVLWACGGDVEVVATVGSVQDAVRAMADRVFSSGLVMDVASSLAAPQMADMTDQLNTLLQASPLVRDLVHYRVGPSVAAQTGPGTAGVFYYPASPQR